MAHSVIIKDKTIIELSKPDGSDISLEFKPGTGVTTVLKELIRTVPASDQAALETLIAQIKEKLNATHTA